MFSPVFGLGALLEEYRCREGGGDGVCRFLVFMVLQCEFHGLRHGVYSRVNFGMFKGNLVV